MANVFLTFALLLYCSILLSNVNGDEHTNENLDDYYRPQIHSLVNYLNREPDRAYAYNYATLINAQNKDPLTVNLVIDVEIACRKPLLCITDKLTCSGNVKYDPASTTYKTLPDVYCQPKTRIDLTKSDDLEPTTESQSEINSKLPLEQNAGVKLTHEVGSVGDASGEQFIAVRPNIRYCAGCPIDINTNVEGLDSLTSAALQHIETERDKKLVVIKILRVQQQVVAGVKYILLLEVAQTNCPKNVDPSNLESCIHDSNCATEICEIVYWQQPWINKNKHIIKNNCTRSQEFIAPEEQTEVYGPSTLPDDMDNEIRVNYDPPKTTDVNLGGIISATRVKEMESQIVYKNPLEEPTTEGGLTDSQKAALEGFLTMMGDQPRKKRSIKNKNNDDDSSNSSSSEEKNNNDEDDIYKEHIKEKLITSKQKLNEDNDDNNDTSSSSDSSDEDEKNNTGRKRKNKRSLNMSSKSKETSEEIKDIEEKTTKIPNAQLSVQLQRKDASSSEESLENSKTTEHLKPARKRRNIINDIVKVTPDETFFVQNLANLAVSELDDIDTDNFKRVVLQILGAKKMHSEGILYYLTLRVGVSKCAEKHVTIPNLNKHYPPDECREKLFYDLTKICRVQVRVTEEKTDPKIEKAHCQDIKKDRSDSNRTHRTKRGIPGGVNRVDPNDPKILELAQGVLRDIDNKNGLKEQRVLVKVLEGSRQVVSGMLYKILVEIKHGSETMMCNIEIWDQPWIKNGKKVKETCGNNEQKSYRFKRSVQLLGRDDHDIHLGLFKKFTEKYHKIYKNDNEFKKRFYIFRENAKKIKDLNRNEQGTAKYGLNMFADLTEEEFTKYKGLRPDLKNPNYIPYSKAVIPDIDLPVEFDWRKKGVISEVKNQGSCGSCWAFSVTGNVEGLNAIKTGKMVELSEQELIDCDKLDEGCQGGLPDNAYRSIEKLGGLESEDDYPYEGENEKCHFNKSLTKVQITGAVNISSDEVEMAKWLVKNGPISIGINANAMQFYFGGISHPWKMLCDPKNLDHGVLIVGFGVHHYPLFNRTMPFWIIKNSWGPSWGEQGYYRVFRGDGTCGLNQMVESATLD